MKITIELTSLEELDSLRGTGVQTTGTLGYLEPEPSYIGTIPADEPAQEETPTPEPKPVKEEVPAPEPEPVKEEAPAPDAEPDYELLRMEVRQTLAELNRTHDDKPAKKLIQEITGVSGLTNVPGNRLQELMDAAKGMM